MNRPNMKRIWYWLPLILFAALLAAFLFSYNIGRDPNILPSVLIDKPMPQFVLPDLSGRTPPVDLFKGKVSLVNFFASWCVPCRLEHNLLKQLDVPGTQRIGILYKDTRANGDEFLNVSGNPYTFVLHDESGKGGIEWGISGVPETFLIDAKGRIRYHFSGPLSESQIQEIRDAMQRMGRE